MQTRPRRKAIRWTLVLALVCLAAEVTGCATARPYTSGRKGFFETLSSRGTPARIKRYSAIEPQIEEEDGHAQTSEAVDDPKVQKVRALVQGWQWPLARVNVTSQFGERGASFHEGVDLAAAVGTPVLATEQGKVVFAGSKIRGYGLMVILKHPQTGLLSVYAHLSRFAVKTGQNVKRGQKIALSGKSGRATGPHLHFEIRRGVVSYDPRHLLGPTRKFVQVASRR